MPKGMPTNACEGFSLVEILIAAAIGLVVLGAAYRALIVQQKIMAAQEQVTETQQNARAAIDFMTRELRMARDITAHDPTPDNSSIAYVSIQDLCQERGFERGDNTLRYYEHCPTPARAGCPQPTYANPAPDVSCPKSTEISRQPLAENIESLTIARSGTENLFTITLTARTADKDPGLKDYRRVTTTSKVRPRNLP